MLRTLTIATGVLVLLSGCAPEKSKSDAPVQKSADAATPTTGSNPQAGDAPPIQAPTPEVGAPEIRYSCDDGRAVAARYGDADVRLSISGKTVDLPNVIAASGSKYMRRDGISPGKSLTWWTKGDEAMLIEAPSDAPPDSSDGETVVNCRSASEG